MTRPTPLDAAHADMQHGDDAARLKFYELVLDSELCLWLQEPAAGQAITPQILPVDGADFVMVFDTEDRLAEASGGTVDKALLPGRALVSMIAGQGLGLAVNVGVAPSAILIGPDGVDWMGDIMAQTSTQDHDLDADSHEATLTALAPVELPEIVLARLAEKLGTSAGQADRAILAQARFDGQDVSHILAFVGAAPGVHAALVEAANQALAFSGLSDQTRVDVTFVEEGSERAKLLAQVGQTLSMRRAEPRVQSARPAPGRDSDKPPKLR